MKKILLAGAVMSGAILVVLAIATTNRDATPLVPASKSASRSYLASAYQSAPHGAQAASQESSKEDMAGQEFGPNNENFMSWSSYDQETDFEMRSLRTADMPASEKEDLKKDIENLRKSGSFSGGRITHEFAKADAARQQLARAGGEQKFKEGLSYTPLKFEQLLGSGFRLAGADYAGALVEGRGFGAGYYLYEAANAKVEISETPLGGEGGARNVMILAETVNHYITGKPATLETLAGRRGEPIVNIHWNSNARNYSMSTMNMDREAAIQLAERISQAADLADRK